jgi:hypothetical protein
MLVSTRLRPSGILLSFLMTLQPYNAESTTGPSDKLSREAALKEAYCAGYFMNLFGLALDDIEHHKSNLGETSEQEKHDAVHRFFSLSGSLIYRLKRISPLSAKEDDAAKIRGRDDSVLDLRENMYTRADAQDCENLGNMAIDWVNKAVAAKK